MPLILGNEIHHLIFLSIVFCLIGAAIQLKWKDTFLNWFLSFPLKRRLLIIFVICQSLFILSSYVMVRKGVVLRGDEPHYLAVSHSLANDFDLNMFNQYFRGGYKDFIQVQDLDPHQNFGRGYKKTYSMHLPGVAVTLAPFFFFKLPFPLLYFLIRSYLGLFGALLAVVVYLFSRRIWNDSVLSIWITGVFMFTVPVFFYSIHIFPAVQALLLILSSLYLLIYSERGNNKKILLAGFLLSITVFWGVRYNLFVYALTIGFSLYFLFNRQLKRALLFAVFPVLLQGLFFFYLYFAYGNFSFSSINYGMMDAVQKKTFMQNFLQSVSFRARLESMLGMFWDQRDGLLLYNPLYFFFFPGLLIALKKIRKYWFPIMLSIPVFFYILSLGFSTIRAGDCPQARYLVPVTGFLMFFVIVYLKETPNRLFKKILIWSPVYSFFVVFYQVFSPFTLYQSTTNRNIFRPGLMFQQWGSLPVPLPRFLPSFIKIESNHLYIPNIACVLIFVLLIVLALRSTKEINLNKVPPLLFFTGFVLFSLFPRIPLYNPVLVENNDIMPHRIYGESEFPSRKKDYFIVMNRKEKVITFSSHKPVQNLQLELKSEYPADMELELYNYDEYLGGLHLSKNIGGSVQCFNPVFKKLGQMYFYRIYIKSIGGKETPSVRIRLIPGNRIAGSIEKDY